MTTGVEVLMAPAKTEVATTPHAMASRRRRSPLRVAASGGNWTFSVCRLPTHLLGCDTLSLRWAVHRDMLFGGAEVAGRPGQYYRAGHWVNRSAGKGKSAKKSATGIVVVGLLVVGAWMGLFSQGSDAKGTTPQPSHTSSPSAKH